MNNNQNNFNINSENTNSVSNNQNIQPTLNVIPVTNPMNSNPANSNYQPNNTFNNNVNNNSGVNPNQNVLLNQMNQPLNNQQNRFITDNIDTTTNHLNNLNVETEHGTTPKVDYSQDPKVQENLKKKNTITITSEGRVFIVIIIVLLIFIFVLPTIFEWIRNIQYQ